MAKPWAVVVMAAGVLTLSGCGGTSATTNPTKAPVTTLASYTAATATACKFVFEDLASGHGSIDPGAIRLSHPLVFRVQAAHNAGLSGALQAYLAGISAGNGQSALAAISSMSSTCQAIGIKPVFTVSPPTGASYTAADATACKYVFEELASLGGNPTGVRLSPSLVSTVQAAPNPDLSTALHSYSAGISAGNGQSALDAMSTMSTDCDGMGVQPVITGWQG